MFLHALAINVSHCMHEWSCFCARLFVKRHSFAFYLYNFTSLFLLMAPFISIPLNTLNVLSIKECPMAVSCHTNLNQRSVSKLFSEETHHFFLYFFLQGLFRSAFPLMVDSIPMLINFMAQILRWFCQTKPVTTLELLIFPSTKCHFVRN